MRSLDDIRDEFEFLEGDERFQMWIELGRELEPMPDALKTEQTLVKGCQAAVWAYPTRPEGQRLHFLADSNSAITKGIIALVISLVQDRTPREILATDIEAIIAPFGVERFLSSKRTSGIPNMIALIRDTALRYEALS